MKTEIILTVGICILILAIICFFIFMIYEKDPELYIHTIIKTKQTINFTKRSRIKPNDAKTHFCCILFFQFFDAKNNKENRKNNNN